MDQSRYENAPPLRSGMVLPTDQHELALLYARAGIRVFPLNPKTRLPIEKKPEGSSEKWGHHRATTDERQIAYWWMRWPKAAVGIVTDDFWVLDLDGKSPPPNNLSMAARSIGTWTGLHLEELKRDCSLVVQTPNSKGWHLYFPAIDGLEIRTGDGDIGPHVDTRGHRANGEPTGYIPAPGAIAYGGKYRVIHGQVEALLGEGLNYAPRRLSLIAHFSAKERQAVLDYGPDMLEVIERQPPETWREEFVNLLAFGASRRPRPVVRQRQVNSDDRYKSAMRRQAIQDLNEAVAKFAFMIDGRTTGAHEFGLRLGKYIAHDILALAEIEAAFASAWRANGSEAKRGWSYGKRQLLRGLEHTKSAPLPPLARRFLD